MLFENVPNVAQAQGGAPLIALVNELESRGYGVHLKVLEAWRYRVPQHRSRLFVIGIAGNGRFQWPKPVGRWNVTEWAKQQACWHRVMNLHVAWPESLETELVSSAERDEVKRTAVRDQKMLNGIEAQTAVVQAGSALWSDVRDWGMSKGLLSPDDRGILDVAISMPAKVPSEKQSVRTIEILQRLREEGCQLEVDGV